MNTHGNRYLQLNYSRRTKGRCQPAVRVAYAILTGMLLIGCPGIARGDMSLRIEWLGSGWDVVTDTSGQGDYQAHTDVQMASTGNVPTIMAGTQAQGGQDQESSATAQVKVSRDFRVVLDDSPSIPVQLQGETSGEFSIWNTWGGDDGEVRFQAKAGVEGTPLQYDRTWELINKDGSYPVSDTIAVDGALPANQIQTATGYAYALGDSDLGHTGHPYEAYGTLSLPEPIVITDRVADYYYDVEWQQDLWSSTITGDADDIGVLDIFSDIITGSFPPPWDTLLNVGLDSYFKKSGSAEKMEGYFRAEDGESYVYARGRFGGHAWACIESERDFMLVQASNAMARLRFDGSLTGELFSSPGTSSAVSLAGVSVADTGLDWAISRIVSDGDSSSVQEIILALGLAELDRTYTFEGLLDVSSMASAGSLSTYADFMSSFEGVLSVQPIPAPPAMILGAVGIVMSGIRLRRRRRA